MKDSVFFDAASGKVLRPQHWSYEAELDKLILTFPELVSIVLTGGEDFVVALAGKDHGGPQILQIDALFLLDDGDKPPRLVIWENKRQGDVDPRRMVGQVIDYASELASLPGARFEELLQERVNNPSWLSAYQQSFARRGRTPPSDVATVVARALEAHKAGCFVLVVCAESLPDDVVRMSRWLSDQWAETNVEIQPVEVQPVGTKGWARAAAVRQVAQFDRAIENLDAKFNELVEQFQRVRSAEVVGVEVSAVASGVTAFSPLAAGGLRGGAVAAKPIALEAWRAGAEPSMRQLQEYLAAGLSPDEVAWSAGTSALLLSVRVGAELVEGLRLFSNRMYFVSDKALTGLGASAAAEWWRHAVAKFPVTDAMAKQPVVPSSGLGDLVAVREDLIAFLRELRRRALGATLPAG